MDTAEAAHSKQKSEQSPEQISKQSLETTSPLQPSSQVAELMQANALLQESLDRLRATVQAERDRAYRQQNMLLGSVNAAARCLVTHSEVSAALPAVLKILGEGTQQSRAYILKNFVDPHTGEMAFDLAVEWDASNIPSKQAAGGRFPVPIRLFPDRLTTPLKAGKSTQFLARDLDGLTDRPAGQALSLVGVPINVKGKWWGLLGLDDCEYERVWSESEIAVLETAAASIGGALEREWSHQQREAAAKAQQVAEQDALLSRERAARAAELEAANQVLSTRERWLEATAAAAHELLSTANVSASVNAALRTIGENLDCDRLGIMRYVATSDPQSSSKSGSAPAHFQFLYEWNSAYALAHAGSPSPSNGYLPISEISDWAQRLMSGQWAGGIIKDQRDPFRRKMQRSGTLSAYAVPIFIESEFWGLMFMDYCRELRLLTPPELAVFSTAATCVGSAIHRGQMSRDRQQAEQNALLTQERNRLAREIHDTLAQTFTGVSLQLEAAKGILKQQPEAAKLYITHAGDLARRGLSEARRSVQALRAQALENNTLPAVLQNAIQELTQNSSTQATFHLVGTPYALSAELQTNLLRISQEAITNTLRHANAAHLTLTLQFSSQQVLLTVADDGCGCEFATLERVEGFGLVGIRERVINFGGQFSFTSSPEQGTLLEVSIPTAVP